MRGALVRRGTRYSAVLYEGQGADGKPRQRWIALGTDDRQLAERKLGALLGQWAAGTLPQAPADLTLGAFLEQWLAARRPALAGKTHERYADLATHYITPRVGQVPVVKLTALHLQRLYADLATAGLAAQTVVHVHRLLSAAFGRRCGAVAWGLLPTSPVERAQPPRPPHPEIRALSHADARRLLAGLAPHYRLPALVALASGLRRGEVLGLRWQDVDLDAARLRVHQTLEQTKAGVAVKAPKSATSRRTVSLPAVAVEALRAHEAAGPTPPAASAFVFARPDGTPPRPDDFSSAFRRAARNAGVPTHFHALRHSAATWALAAGRSVRAVATRLGHADPALTLRTYAHALPDDDAQAAAVVEAALRAPGAT